MTLRGSYNWPKTLPDLTTEQQEISDDFMRYWHERLGSGILFRAIEQFNHGYAVRHAPTSFLRTLEIGAGLGEHLQYEKLNEQQRNNYYALELRENMVSQLRARFPDIQATRGDCQRRLDFPDHYFDRIIAVHVLEHLPDLPAAIKEMYRLSNKQSGVFSIVIPCEGGLAYRFARLISARRLFEARYKQSYDWFIDREHLNVPGEVKTALEQYFTIINVEYFPFSLPLIDANLCIGLNLRPKPQRSI